jgi:hypothetical protein
VEGDSLLKISISLIYLSTVGVFQIDIFNDKKTFLNKEIKTFLSTTNLFSAPYTQNGFLIFSVSTSNVKIGKELAVKMQMKAT